MDPEKFSAHRKKTIESEAESFSESESNHSWWQFGMATCCLLAGLVLLFFRPSLFCTGSAIPLLLGAAFELTGGMASRQNALQIKTALKEMGTLTSDWIRSEAGNTEMRLMVIGKQRNYLTIAFVAGVLLMLSAVFMKSKGFMFGFGISLMSVSAIVLCLDMMAEFRSSSYFHQLNKHL